MRGVMKIGVIGCGSISKQYLTMAGELPMLQVQAVADLNAEAAGARADEFDIPQVLTVEQMLADPEIQLVVNLTIPKAHYEVAANAIAAGKHVWNEKPLTLTLEQGRQLVQLADDAGVLLGCAPDTFFGSAHQTARKLIDDGVIGKPISAMAFMLCPGHEQWHPSPAFYYQPGGGPMLDMGPYYITALMHMLGNVQRVSGATCIGIPERTVGKGPLAGTKIAVEVADHVSGQLEFENGVVATVVTSFASWFRDMPHLIVNGESGTLRVGSPNGYDEPVELLHAGAQEWEPISSDYCTEYRRMIGVADMANAVMNGRAHRAGGRQALAVLEVMLGILASGEDHQVKTMSCRYDRPALLPEGLAMGELD